MDELTNPPDINRACLFACIKKYPHTFDLDGNLTEESIRTAREASAVFQSLPIGPIYPKTYYSSDDSMIYRVKSAGKMVVRLPESIGDTLMLLPAIQALCGILEQDTSNGVDLIVRTGHSVLLSGLNGITTAPLRTWEKDPQEIVLDLSGRSKHQNNNCTSVSWFRPYGVLPINSFGEERRWNGPALALRVIEMVMGYKTLPIDIMSSYPLPKIDSFVLSNREEVITSSPYLVTANTATIGPRRWPDSQYAEMMQMLSRVLPNHNIVYIADPGMSDKQTVHKIKDIPNVVVYKNKIAAVMKLINGAQAGLFTDSGMGHISALFIPTLRCFSCSNPHFWSIPGNKNDNHLSTDLALELQESGSPLDPYPFRFKVQNFTYSQIVGQGQMMDMGLFELSPEKVITHIIQLLQSPQR